MKRFDISYDGQDLLSGIKKMSAIRSMKDVENLTHTLYPGPRCPMIGALMTVRGFKDSLAVVVGTDECVYYSKNLTLAFDGFGGIDGRCVCVRLDTNDVTFGSVETVAECFDEIIEEYDPACVFLISTCLIEIIGDDFDALALSLSKKYDRPILPVHTEHFKCEDQLPGVERSLVACVGLMEKQECNDAVNILGQRHGDFHKSELARILKEQAIEINLEMPNICYLDDIKRATRAKLNIVVNSTALELAKKMYEKFSIPYVVFYKYADPNSTFRAYKEIFGILEMDFPKDLKAHYDKAKQDVEDRKDMFAGIKYVYGGAPFVPFEHIRLMCELGLEPQLIQISEINKEDENDIEIIKSKFDPYITRSANSSGMLKVYDVLKPDIVLGAIRSPLLEERKIVPLFVMNYNDLHGFELSDLFIEALDKAKQELIELREKN